MVENSEKVKESVRKIDEKVQRKEKLININGGFKNNPEDLKEITSLKVDSLKAKLALLENVSNNIDI